MKLSLTRVQMMTNQTTKQILLDGDILRYELGFGAQIRNEVGDQVILPFDHCLELLDIKLAEITEMIDCTDNVRLFLTEDRATVDRLNSRRQRKGQEMLEYLPNFRELVATTRPYKGNRLAEKPYHYHNLTEYFLSEFDCTVARGLEADDLLTIEQLNAEPETTIIVSRDKDLRQCPGWHYSWTCGNALARGPDLIDELGFIEPSGKGGGLKFFYAQMLMGDPVDNIPGIPKMGKAKAHKLLSDCENEAELFERVSEVYMNYCADNDMDWRTYFKEQANLLWMVRALDDKGRPVLHIPYDER